MYVHYYSVLLVIDFLFYKAEHSLFWKDINFLIFAFKNDWFSNILKTPTFALMGLAHFTCDKVLSIKCLNSNMTTFQDLKAFSTNSSIPVENYFIHEDLHCCKLEEKEKCFENMTSENDVLTESFKDMFLDSTNEGTRTIVEFPEIWKRRIREVQGRAN